jgi:ABC-type thiamine transport system ATPase subunit
MWVEQFDVARYNRNATLAENLLFGTPIGRKFDIDNLAKNAYVRRVLAETGLIDDMLRTGHKLAETMVELFSGLAAGHEFFERYSFVRHEDLPHVEEILGRVRESGLEKISEDDRNDLLALPFKLIQARHRLGLIDETFEGRVVEARRYFAAHLPADLSDAIEFFDPERYNSAASLQDNMLFGRIVTGQAGAAERIGALLRKVLDELGLRSQVVKIGLDYQVGVGGARLAGADRQKIAMARAILRQPVVLIVDQALAVLDSASQQRVVANVLERRRERCVIWFLNRIDLAERFGQVIVMERGRLAERGSFVELKSGGRALQKLLSAG